MNDTIAERFCYSSKQLDSTKKEHLNQWRVQQRQDESRVKKRLSRAVECYRFTWLKALEMKRLLAKFDSMLFSIFKKKKFVSLLGR